MSATAFDEPKTDLSAKTPILSTVHHPFGSPTGPGLWHHKGMQLPAYIQNIAHALVRNGHSESSAIAIAVATVKKWAAGGGNTSPEVKAAAAKALAEWEKLRGESHARMSEELDDRDEELIMGFAAAAQATPPDGDTGDSEPDTGQDPLTHADGGIDLPPADANYRQAQDPQTSCATCIHFQPHPQGDDGFCDLYNCSSDKAWVSDGWAAANAAPAGTPPTGANAAEFADPQTFHEIFLADTPANKDGWTVLVREGLWAMSPEQGTQKPVKKPIIMKPDGETVLSDEKIEVSMQDLMDAWKDGAIEHVTIPTSHQDGVLENTGFIRDMRMGQDEDGKAVLEVLPEFLDPEVKAKTKLGTIANKSAGILFDYVRKVDGKKFRAAIGHMALTNKPWLNGLKPFGVNAGEKIAVMSFAEAQLDSLTIGVTPCTDEKGNNGFMGDSVHCRTHDGSEADMQRALKQAAADAGVTLSEEEVVLALASMPGQQAPDPKQPTNEHLPMPRNVTACMVGGQSGFAAEGGMCHTHDGTPDSIKAAMVKAAGEAGTHLSEDEISDYVRHHTGGGDRMSELLEDLEMSEDQVRAALAERETLLAERRTNRIEDLCSKWEKDDHKAPAVIAAARDMLLGQVKDGALLLSENGKTKEVSFEDALIAIVEASPEVKLAEEDKGPKAKDTADDPVDDTEHENAAANLSAEVKVEANRLFFEEGKSSEEAIRLAKQKFDVKDDE